MGPRKIALASYGPARQCEPKLVAGGGPVAFAAAAIRRTARASETPALFFLSFSPTIPARVRV